MKITTKLLFVLTICLTCLVSCSLPFGGDTDNTGDSGDQNTPTLPEDFVLVLPDANVDDRTMKYVSSALGTVYSEMYGKTLQVSTDKAAPGTTKREIVFGDTSRAISDSAMDLMPKLDVDDAHIFAIYAKDGNVAIYANGDNAYKVAADWFCKNMLADVPVNGEHVYFTTEAIRKAEGNENARCFTIDKLSTEIFVDSVLIDGEEFADFDADTYDYEITVAVRNEIPKIDFVCPGFVTATVVNADDLNTTATVTLKSLDGSNVKTYTFKFNKEEASVLNNAFVEKVYGGKKSIVVIVHDDGTHATVDYMTSQFESYGLVGTLGLITKNLAQKTADGRWALKSSEVAYWRAILNRGVFDVASHSHTHSFWGLTDEDEWVYHLGSDNKTVTLLHIEAGRITEEVAGSREILKMAFPDQDVLAFIKPGFGRSTDANGTTGMTQISDKAYEIIAENYIGMRNTGGGVSDIPVPDIYNVTSHTVKGADTAATWQSEVNKAINKNGMIVFLYHTITENPEATSLSAKMSETDVFFEWLGEKSNTSDVWNTFLEDAMLYTEEYAAAKVEALDLGDSIRVSVTTGLDTDIYNHPLTVNVTLPEGVSSVTAEYADGSTEELEIVPSLNGGYVRVNVVPDGSHVFLITE